MKLTLVTPGASWKVSPWRHRHRLTYGCNVSSPFRCQPVSYGTTLESSGWPDKRLLEYTMSLRYHGDSSVFGTVTVSLSEKTRHWPIQRSYGNSTLDGKDIASLGLSIWLPFRIHAVYYGNTRGPYVLADYKDSHKRLREVMEKSHQTAKISRYKGLQVWSPYTVERPSSSNDG